MSGSTLGIAATSLLGTLLALALVLALAYGALKLLRRMQDRVQPGAAAGPGLRVVRALGVGPRERVVLIEAGDEQLLIGVAAGQVTLLSRWPAAPPPDEAP